MIGSLFRVIVSLLWSDKFPVIFYGNLKSQTADFCGLRALRKARNKDLRINFPVNCLLSGNLTLRGVRSRLRHAPLLLMESTWPTCRLWAQSQNIRQAGRKPRPIHVRDWLGRQGSNLRMAASKAAALPLGDAPATHARRPYGPRARVETLNRADRAIHADRAPRRVAGRRGFGATSSSPVRVHRRRS